MGKENVVCFHNEALLSSKQFLKCHHKAGTEKKLHGFIIKLWIKICPPSHIWPPILIKPIKRAKVNVENRTGRFTQCGCIGKTEKGPVNPPTLEPEGKSKFK